jgi:ribosome-associated translation inhibitor RaiA
MKIQINTGHNIKGSEKFNERFTNLLSEELDRFSSQITRLEVHFSDEDGKKDGLNDKRCMIEARLEGLKPIAVTNYADTHEDAISGAIDKLISSLNTRLERLKGH